MTNHKHALDLTRNLSVSHKRRLKRLSQISLWLDSYDDIFSDFDPRPFAERALSDDFLQEAKKASYDKNDGNIRLQFLVPLHERKKKHEPTIQKRLRNHFKKHYTLLRNEHLKLLKMGYSFCMTGVILMLLTAYVFVHEEALNFFVTFLAVIMEPGGWFLFWEGLNIIVFESKKQKPNLDFYEKMSRCYIEFQPY